jgi:Flp pilus assembly protein TadD
MSAPALPAAPQKHDRDAELARLVLSKRLATREHVEECLKAARDLAKRGKPLAIEEIFVRKGYLSRPDAQALARKASAAAPAPDRLELVPEKKGRRCPGCDKDPGHALDYCPRCGADLETGGPGPDSTICASCSRVVKKGSTVCPRCARPIERTSGRPRSDVAWLDRLVVLAVLGACFYFLVYRHVIAPPPANLADDDAGKTPAERVQGALARGDLDAASHALEDACATPDHDPGLDAACVLACLRAGRGDAAKAALLAARKTQPDSVDLMLLAVEVSATLGDADGAKKALALVPDAARDDRWQRARARAARAAREPDEETAALGAIKARTPEENDRRDAVALYAAQKKIEAGDLDGARAALEKLVAGSPGWEPARVKLGVLFLKAGKPSEAAVQLERACQIAPRDPAAQLGRGIAYDRLRNFPEAVSAYKTYLGLAGPEDATEVKTIQARVAALGASR